jgi:translocation and assembly module TamA
MILYRLLLALSAAALMAVSVASAQGNLAVSVDIEGVDRELRRELRKSSALARNSKDFSALAPIRRAANTDAEAFLAALQSKGFYAARVEPQLMRDNNDVTVTFTIDRGPRFDITDYEIVYVDEREEPRPQNFAEADLEAEGAPTGEALQELEAGLLERLWNRGYLGAEVTNRAVLSDFSQGTATARFEVRTGAEAHYGQITVEGLDRTDPDYIRMMRPFETGDLAQREDLDEYRERLIETSLFSEVEVLPSLPAEDGTTDILVRLNERKRRTLGGGVAYSTDIGPGVNAFWENRNLLRRGETLRISAIASEPLQELGANFRKWRPQLPGYYTLSTIARNEDTDAFNAQTFEVGGAIAKLWFDRNLTTEGGLRYQYSDIESFDSLGEDRDRDARIQDVLFRAVSIPLTVFWNSQVAPLDPQRGFLAGVTVTPFFGTEDFTRIEGTYTDRVFWGEDDGGTLAGRIMLGAIYGADRGQIPATERFYAGGGGSIRGYAFQEASPVDPRTGDILGGASVAEFNFELRQHVTRSIELAGFVDFGSSFEANTPDFDNVLVGAGLGIRYHTPIGPLRLDVAMPLDRREVFIPDTDRDDDLEPDRVFQDTAFQIYIALGQPF